MTIPAERAVIEAAINLNNCAALIERPDPELVRLLRTLDEAIHSLKASREGTGI